MSCFAFAWPCLPASSAKQQRACKPRPVNGVAIAVDLGPRKSPPPMLLARLQGPRRSDEVKVPSASSPRAPPSKEAAEKAKVRNDEKRAVAKRVREERERELTMRLVELNSSMSQACDRRSEVLVGISKKAHAHVEAVAEKASKSQQRASERARRTQLQLQRDRCVAIRHGQASSHNKLVSEKLQQHHEKKRLQMEELRAQVVGGPRPSSASSRAARSAHHNLKVRSKVQHQQLLMKQREEALKAKLEDKASRVAKRIVQKSGQLPVAAVAA